MKQNYYLILGIVVVTAVVAVFLLSEYSTEPNTLTENPVVINTESSGTPSSPMDLEMLIKQFDDDKTSEITVKIGKRTGYPAEGFKANDTKAEIQLPEGLELVEGDTIWKGDIIGEEVSGFKIKVRAIKNGEWVINANANFSEGDNIIGDMEKVYILVREDEVLISDRSFTPVSPPGKAKKR